MDPISQTDTSVTYLGVRLEKAQDASGDLVPKKARFSDYVNHSVALDLQKRLAIAFHLGQPILIEGGTGIGKTTTVEKMAADLGWEVHSVVCPWVTKPEHLMGEYSPNTKTSDSPYHFVDGPVTRGLRQEEGRTKVILLEDLNFIMREKSHVLAVLQEVLEALERDVPVVVRRRVHKLLRPRYGSAIVPLEERVEVSRRKTKVVALVCPPEPPYRGREPFHPAFLDLWTYQKMPLELPEADRKAMLLHGL